MTYSEIMIAEIQNGNLDAALNNLDLALENDDEDTLFLLGNTLFQLGFLNETKSVYNHLITINPTNDELKIYLAEIEIEDGNEIEALELLHTIDKTSLYYPQSLLVQADYYHLKSLPEVSIQKLREAQELLPDEEIIQFALGEVYNTIADYQQAIKYYENLMEDGHEEISGTILSVRLGNCYLMIGEYDNALEYLNASLSFRDDPEVYYQIGLIYVQKEEYEKAVTPLLKAKEIDPSLIGIFLLLAEVYEQQNELEKALDEIKASLSYNETNIDIYFKAAELSTKLGDVVAAEKYYQIAYEMDKENERSVIKYAGFLNYVEDFEATVELLENTPETIKELPESLWLLANAKNGLEEYEAASSYFNKASLFLMEDLEFLKDFAFFLKEDGQRDKMKEIVKHYLTLSDEVDEEMNSLLVEDEMY